MASTTNLKFPDGRIQENVEVLTSFEKNNELVLLFKTDIMANQNQVFGLCYYVDGMYQNIVDPVKQKEIKGYLVDILKDRMDNSNYRVVPEEILVTADPYYPLALRLLKSILLFYNLYKQRK